jgi:hypothetical protein
VGGAANAAIRGAGQSFGVQLGREALSGAVEGAAGGLVEGGYAGWQAGGLSGMVSGAATGALYGAGIGAATAGAFRLSGPALRLAGRGLMAAGRGVGAFLEGLDEAVGQFGMMGVAGHGPRVPLRAGQAGRFADLDRVAVLGDSLTPHHMPQAALRFTTRADGGAIAIPNAEHVLTRTYFSAGARLAVEEAGVPFRTVLARDIRDLRSIAGRKYNAGIRDLLDYYRVNFPELIAKPRKGPQQ